MKFICMKRKYFVKNEIFDEIINFLSEHALKFDVFDTSKCIIIS